MRPTPVLVAHTDNHTSARNVAASRGRRHTQPCKHQPVPGPQQHCNKSWSPLGCWRKELVCQPCKDPTPRGAVLLPSKPCMWAGLVCCAPHTALAFMQDDEVPIALGQGQHLPTAVSHYTRCSQVWAAFKLFACI